MLVGCLNANAQDGVPYYEIPDAPQEFSAKNIVSRSIDGFGFRYHWATKDLTNEDFEFRPTEESRSIRETMEHIATLTEIVLKAVSADTTEFPLDWSAMTGEELRLETLKKIQMASRIVRDSKNSFNQMSMVFKGGENITVHPFWNLLNGPLEDAVYHAGQITTLRRSSGNPIPKGISMLQGKVVGE